MVTFLGGPPRGAAREAQATIAANDARVTFSDYAGTLTRTSSYARVVRPIVDGQGLEYAEPGVRARANITMANSGMVTLTLAYTGLITRGDTYADQGVILVDGAVYATFNCPVPHSGSEPHPTGIATPSIALAAGVHLVEVVFPYCASLDLVNVKIPVSASIAAPAGRPSFIYAAPGDSLSNSFYTANAYSGWVSTLGRLRSAQVKNLGYGGRVCVPSDGTVAGATGCDLATYLIGYNDYYTQVPLATFQANHQAWMTNFRAAAVTAGKPTAKLVIITPIFATTAPPGSPPLTLENYREKVRASFAAVGDPYAQLKEGLATGMPSSGADLVDGIHPNDAGALKIANVLNASIT